MCNKKTQAYNFCGTTKLNSNGINSEMSKTNEEKY